MPFNLGVLVLGEPDTERGVFACETDLGGDGVRLGPFNWTGGSGDCSPVPVIRGSINGAPALKARWAIWACCSASNLA